MIKKFGKPIDIIKFKSSMLDTSTLRSLIKKYKQVSDFVYKSPHCKKISSCPICNSRDKLMAQVIYKVAYNKCDKCQALYTNKQPDMDKLNRYYTKSKNYSKQVYSDRSTYKYRAKETSLPKIEFVSGFVTTPKRRWLDIGSGIGDVVYNLNKKGFSARGLELNEESIRFSKKLLGQNLENKTIFDVLKQEGPDSFDVISYFGVLEHIPDPLKQISCAVKLLSPGGLLVLEVPNAKSFSVMTDLFFPDSVVRHMIPAFHIMLFSEKSLTYLARKFRLKPEAMWYIGLDFYNLILHISLRIPGFMESDVCKKLLCLNNGIQKVFDTNEMSDDIIFICRKGRT